MVEGRSRLAEADGVVRGEDDGGGGGMRGAVAGGGRR